MSYSKSLLIFSLFIFFNNTFSQTGPGGVGNTTSNGLWLKADDIILASGSNVSSWNDASGNNNDGNQTNSILQPTFFSTSALNNMPVVRLDGSNDEIVVSDSNILDGTSGMTYFTVLRPNNLNNSSPKAVLSKRNTHTSSTNYAYSFFFYTNNYLNSDIVYLNNRFTTNPTSFSNATNYILGMGFDGSVPAISRSKIYSAGSLIQQAQETSSTIINSASDLLIGSLNIGYGQNLGADLAEIIHFNYSLNDAEHIIVNNYLSAKYNIALTTNDLYLQDDSANGNFDFDVAGIGQATNGDNHTDSQGTGIVRINNPSTLSSGDYLFWGEETKVIQALPQIDINDNLPLKIKVTDPGIYKFSIDKMKYVPNTMDIFLKDNNKNLYYNLRHGEIQIILDEVKEYNEFSIVFKKDSALETTTFKNEKFFTFYNPENKHLELYNIDSISNIESLNIYNTLGQIIISLNSLEANTINISNLNDGIYILKAKTKNAQNLKSNKFVKY
ncbi:hypothetical protein A8C32_14640 [Flavivirga aquatica]|uniref:Secretion system C-terminal sorting domain-containing protein n=1 Tax=Flavivirga aquatica TaxID=1849968 RepID=A0A1E5TC08_9FLAO|nr:T9SS type A sorting domain-containing protein [Flavivirga aquatica]OEK08923.1 hypothetical protein A8C32_14640 [Flavivirga aquatica]